MGLICAPLSTVAQWITAVHAPGNLWAQKIAGGMTRFSERCPETLGTPAANLAERARTSASQVLSRAKTVTNREIQEVTAAVGRLRMAGLGETRLLGVPVPAQKDDAALVYLQHAVAGKRLAVTVAAGQDPERRPLVVVTRPEGTAVNTRLIQMRLARPWETLGPWNAWAVTPSSTSNQRARCAVAAGAPVQSGPGL